MPSFFPGGQDIWVAKVDNVDTILATHVNDLQNAAASMEIGGVSTQNIAYAASITPNVPAGQYVIVGTLTGNITINAPTNVLTGRRLTFRFTQDGTGSRTVTWNAVFSVTNWTVNTAANAKTEATFTYDGTNWVLASNPALGTITSPIQGVVTEWGNGRFNVTAPQNPSGAAKMDGSDDFPSLKAAVTAATAVGGIVVIPSGTMYCNIDNSGTGAYVATKTITVRGAGRDSTFITTPTAALTGIANLFYVAAGASLTVEDMTVVGPTTLNGTAARAINKASSNAATEFIRARKVYFQGWDAAIQGTQDATSAVCDLTECEFSAHAAPNSAGLCWWDVGTFLASDCYWHDFGLAASLQKHGVYLHKSTSFAFSNHCRWDNNNGGGWCVQVFGGTAGTAKFASYEDCWTGSASVIGFQSSETVKTRFVKVDMNGAGRAIHHHFDIHLSQVTIDNSAGADYCLISGNGTAHKVRVRSSYLKPPAGLQAILTAATDDHEVVDTEFGCTAALATSASAGTFFQEQNKYSDSSGWGASTTANRPPATRAGAGAKWFDSTINRQLLSDGTVWRVLPANLVFALTDAVTVTTDAATGDYFTLSAGAGRTIAAPTNLAAGMELTYEILNNTGGGITTTWNALFHLAGAWVDPAAGKKRTLVVRYNGTVLEEVARAAADIT